MIRRTTLAAEADDLSTLESEARRRGISLAALLRDLVGERAGALREANRPRFGIGRSGRGDVATESVRDEDAPAAPRP